MSTKDQLLYSALHGTAMRYAAERRSLDESIEELREIADGRNDILAEAAGITAGYWYASPATHVGHELIGAGMLILAGGGQGFRWTMTSWSAGRASGSSEGPVLTLSAGPRSSWRRLAEGIADVRTLPTRTLACPCRRSLDRSMLQESTDVV
jgi:hypothetical protein